MTSYTSNLSDYEQLRAKNIERNNKRLRELGLISALEEQISNDKAWGRQSQSRTSVFGAASSSTTTSSLDNSVNSEKNKKKKSTKKRQSSSSSLIVDSDAQRRKSPRLQGLGPELSPTEGEEGNEEVSRTISSTIDDIRKSRVDECRLVREKLARMIQLNNGEGDGDGDGDTTTASATNMEIIAQAGKENPTATYGHCLMRVRTMSHKQLVQRIKTIERAKGKHCVIKMAIFKSCLQDEDMWDLSELADDALERLKALLPPPQPATAS